MTWFAAGGNAQVPGAAARRAGARGGPVPVLPSGAEPTGRGTAGAASRRASVLAAAVLCLLLAARVSMVLYDGWDQVPWTAVLFVLPLLCAFPGTWRLLDRRRWLVLAGQAALTWVPFAVFGGRWQVGIGGLLAGLVLLMVRGRVRWLAAGLLLAADVGVRAGLTGLPWEPAWSGALWAAVAFTDDTLVFFGMVALAQIVGEVDKARGQAADLAVTRERLAAAASLSGAVGQRLAAVAARITAAQRALPLDPARARAQVAAAGTAAREAVAQARAITAGAGALPRPGPAAARAGRTVIGARLAWAVLVAMLSAYAAQGLNDIYLDHDSPRLGALVAGGSVVIVALQLRHSRPGRDGRPRAWPVTLGLQAAVVYVFFLPPLDGFITPSMFLAGSVLLLVPGRWRWAACAAVIASWSALFAAVPLHGSTAAEHSAVVALNEAAEMAVTGLAVYGLSRLAGLARQLEDVRGELARAAAVGERLRLARDVHDLLGLGLSALALKADLAGALAGRDDARAAAEIAAMSRVCAAARVDVRLVADDDVRLSLPGELAAVRDILTSAGLEVRAAVPGLPPPAAAGEVLAPVLREAVTNILRHATATACIIEVTAAGRVLRLKVANDGVPAQPPATRDGSGRGLANLHARVRAAGGQLQARQADGRFTLTAEIPLGGPRLAPAWLLAGRRPGGVLPARWLAGQPGPDDSPATGQSVLGQVAAGP